MNDRFTKVRAILVGLPSLCAAVIAMLLHFIPMTRLSPSRDKLLGIALGVPLGISLLSIGFMLTIVKH